MPCVLPAGESLRLSRSTRWIMFGVATVLATVLGIACWLRPDPRGFGTHQQLGLPPCSFYVFTGLPCPSCGMTTSFTAFMHGEIGRSLKANPIGTVLVVGCLVLVPYLLVCAAKGRGYGVNDYEMFLARIIIVTLIILFLGWGLRLGWRWWTTGAVIDPPAVRMEMLAR